MIEIFSHLSRIDTHSDGAYSQHDYPSNEQQHAIFSQGPSSESWMGSVRADPHAAYTGTPDFASLQLLNCYNGALFNGSIAYHPGADTITGAGPQSEGIHRRFVDMLDRINTNHVRRIRVRSRGSACRIVQFLSGSFLTTKYFSPVPINTRIELYANIARIPRQSFILFHILVPQHKSCSYQYAIRDLRVSCCLVKPRACPPQAGCQSFVAPYQRTAQASIA